ncbi:putative dehydrogenase [Leucobacter exalbidus]|uniref:Dehydrogenase n=1 Tax=Leucobacter exalbidus TaxID=662960 RepID=A0A940T3S3_9MICO|nr:Gfo/Idh/MocA family oxidoreductase [Leucobacter exalbidus]MBP1326462.1 putative dehydrogenase [Leucobacter exalbidus]
MPAPDQQPVVDARSTSDPAHNAAHAAALQAAAQSAEPQRAGSQQLEAMRLGLLGASRIAQSAVIDASQHTGDELTAVAARDPKRARAYAAEHGFAGIRDSYTELVEDDSLDLIYIGLPNGFHAEWSAKALEAGRSVLVEKPFAANLAEFDRVTARLEAGEGWIWEAFHYDDHPLMQRVLEILASGEIGELREIKLSMRMEEPDASDPRWEFALAGGAMMDVGCYAVHALLLLAETTGSNIAVDSVVAELWPADPLVDSLVDAQLTLTRAGAGAADGGVENGTVPVTLRASMVHDTVDFSLELIGTTGTVFAPSYVKPQDDDRIIVRTVTDAGEVVREERAGTAATYVFQLERIRAELRGGVKDPARLARSRATMALIDDIYLAAGLPVRPGRLTD